MNKNKLLIITGKSCSGKNTLANRIKQHYDVHEALSFTTRPMRPGEEQGKDYMFITFDDFFELERQNKLLESIEYHGNRYGLSEYSFDFNKDNIAIVDPEGTEQLRKNLSNRFEIITVLLDAPDEVILERFKNRGDDPEDAKRRFIKDKEMFNPQIVPHDIYVMYPDELDYHSIFKKALKKA